MSSTPTTGPTRSSFATSTATTPRFFCASRTAWYAAFRFRPVCRSSASSPTRWSFPFATRGRRPTGRPMGRVGSIPSTSSTGSRPVSSARSRRCFRRRREIAVLSTANTKERLFVSLVDNVRGRVIAFGMRPADGKPRRSTLPENGDGRHQSRRSATAASVSFSFTDFLTPSSIIWSDDDGATPRR